MDTKCTGRNELAYGAYIERENEYLNTLMARVTAEIKNVRFSLVDAPRKRVPLNDKNRVRISSHRCTPTILPKSSFIYTATRSMTAHGL